MNQAACTSTTPISQAYEGECAGVLIPNVTNFCKQISTECPNVTFSAPTKFPPQNVRLTSLSLDLPAPYLKVLNVPLERSAAVENATPSEENPSNNCSLFSSK